MTLFKTTFSLHHSNALIIIILPKLLISQKAKQYTSSTRKQLCNDLTTVSHTHDALGLIQIVITISVFLGGWQSLEKFMMFLRNDTRFAQCQQIVLLCSWYWQSRFVTLCKCWEVGQKRNWRSASSCCINSREAVCIPVFVLYLVSAFLKSNDFNFEPIHRFSVFVLTPVFDQLFRYRLAVEKISMF